MEAAGPAITGLNYPILIGDIGGTNARFALLTDSMSEPVDFPSVRTAEYASLEETIQKSVMDKTSLQPRGAIIAVAGMVSGEEIELTNRGWVFRPANMLQSLGLDGIVVLNDFEAQALAVLALGPGDMKQIGGRGPQEGLPCAVLGPGTGLGVAGLINVSGAWIPLAGEGGHIDIGPRNEREMDVFRHLGVAGGRVSAEHVLSGRGLANLYFAICSADGKTPSLETPEDVSVAGLSGADTQAEEALRLFVTFLGRLAGDMALIFMSSGGVYLTGGIARKILPALETGAFREAFEDKYPHAGYLASLPVMVVTHPLAALAGLAAYARNPSMFGVDISTRRWCLDP